MQISLNTDYRVVTALDLATGNASLWLNPTSESDTHVTSTGVTSFASVTNVAFHIFGTNSAGNKQIDNLVIGTSFADIPEPGTVALVSLGGLAMWAIRRRRRS